MVVMCLCPIDDKGGGVWAACTALLFRMADAFTPAPELDMLCWTQEVYVRDEGTAFDTRLGLVVMVRDRTLEVWNLFAKTVHTSPLPGALLAGDEHGLINIAVLGPGSLEVAFLRAYCPGRVLLGTLDPATLQLSGTAMAMVGDPDLKYVALGGDRDIIAVMSDGQFVRRIHVHQRQADGEWAQTHAVPKTRVLPNLRPDGLTLILQKMGLFFVTCRRARALTPAADSLWGLLDHRAVQYATPFMYGTQPWLIVQTIQDLTRLPTLQRHVRWLTFASVPALAKFLVYEKYSMDIPDVRKMTHVPDLGLVVMDYRRGAYVFRTPLEVASPIRRAWMSAVIRRTATLL